MMVHSYHNESIFSDPAGQLRSIYLRENEHHHNTTVLSSNYRMKLGSDLHFLEWDYQANISRNNYPLADYIDKILSQEQLLSEDL